MGAYLGCEAWHCQANLRCPTASTLAPGGVGGYMKTACEQCGEAMRAILDVLVLILDLYWWIIILSAILSWLIAFNVVNVRNQFVGTIAHFLHQLTEPALRPIRRFMPDLGGIDISPIVLLIAIYFLKRVIFYYLYPMVI